MRPTQNICSIPLLALTSAKILSARPDNPMMALAVCELVAHVARKSDL